MKDSKGGSPILNLSKKLSERRPDVIYDEAKVLSYTLPDPLICLDGTKVTTPELWRTKRRPEILELFRTHMYGRAPIGKPAGMTFEVFDLDRNALNGKATRKQVRILFTGKPDGPNMDLLIYLPNDVKRPVPVFLLLNFFGNHAIADDPAIRLKPIWWGSWRFTPPALMRGKDPWCPLRKILARGYGIVTAYYGDIVPDFAECFRYGVFSAFDRLFGAKRLDDAWGATAAWAWGLSRAMDYLETDKDVDVNRVIVLGFSRLARAALWAAAQDERFAIANCGGGLWRLNRRQTLAQVIAQFPHWFCENFKGYRDRESDLPVDQHMLIALVAPRPVYIASAADDAWSDPRAEFLAAKFADPVYKLLGTEGLPTREIPALNQPVMGTVGYHIRSGGHNLTEYDWERFMDFADKHFKRPQK